MRLSGLTLLGRLAQNPMVKNVKSVCRSVERSFGGRQTLLLCTNSPHTFTPTSWKSENLLGQSIDETDLSHVLCWPVGL